MSFEKIYIFCPCDVVSGGVNSLQLLCKALISNKKDAHIFYNEPGDDFLRHPVIRSFNLPYVTVIDDATGNLLVVPEAYIAVLNQYASISKMIYWLGIYYYFKKPPHRFPLSNRILRKAFSGKSYFGAPENWFHSLSQKVNVWSKKADPIWHSGIIHMTNSNYAAAFLTFMGVEQKFVLLNPVRDEFYVQKTKPERGKKILFGPGTPQLLINRISKAMAGYECIRLKKLTSDEVLTHLRDGIVYIDLSDFPGRNRMPREAVLSGCVVITSWTGSANYYADLALDDYYKINRKSGYITELITKIEAIADDYPLHYSCMQVYIDSLNREKDNFNAEVARIFEQLNSEN